MADFNAVIQLMWVGAKAKPKIKAVLGMLGGGENICGWLFMMELLLPLGYD